MTQLYGLNVPNINQDRKFEVGDVVVCWLSENPRDGVIAIRRVPALCKVIKIYDIYRCQVEILNDGDNADSYNQYMKPFQQFVDEEIETLEKYREDLLKLSDKVYQETNKQ